VLRRDAVEVVRTTATGITKCEHILVTFIPAAQHLALLASTKETTHQHNIITILLKSGQSEKESKVSLGIHDIRRKYGTCLSQHQEKASGVRLRQNLAPPSITTFHKIHRR